MPANDDLDIRLDAALATYAPSEPAPDLAARILASLPRTAGRGKQRRWLPWIIAIPALAALLFAVLIPTRHQQAHRAAPSATAVTPVSVRPSVDERPARAVARPPRAAAKSQPTFMRVAANWPLPKQEVFPTPTPLTKEEQALVALVNRNPGNVARSVAESQRQPVEPLTIAAIHIPPLDIQPKGSPDKGDK